MLIKHYKRILAAKLIAVLIGGAILVSNLISQSNNSTSTGAIVMLIDGNANFAAATTGSDRRRLLYQTTEQIIQHYPHAPLGVIYAGDEPTYLVPDTRLRDTLPGTIKQLVGLQPPTTNNTLTTAIEYTIRHAQTGSTVFLMSDSTPGSPPAARHQQTSNQKNITFHPLVLNPAGNLPQQTTSGREKLGVTSSQQIHNPADLQQLDLPPPQVVA